MAGPGEFFTNTTLGLPLNDRFHSNNINNINNNNNKNNHNHNNGVDDYDVSWVQLLFLLSTEPWVAAKNALS